MAASYILPRGRMCDSAGARYRGGNGPVSCVVYVKYMWKMYNVYTCDFLNIYIYIYECLSRSSEKYVFCVRRVMGSGHYLRVDMLYEVRVILVYS